MAEAKKAGRKPATKKEEAPITNVETVETDAIVDIEPVVDIKEGAPEVSGESEPTTLEEAIDAVPVEIEHEETIEKIAGEIVEQVTPLVEINEAKESLADSEPLKATEALIDENPDEAEKIIKDEIKKAEELKATVEKKINETPKPTKKHPNVTNWWNGMGYDF